MKRVDLFRFGAEYIESMKELISRYESCLDLGISKSDYERANKMKCLLCHPIGINLEKLAMDEQRYIGCPERGCPWHVVMNTGCHDVYDSTDPHRIKLRIKQLKRWIKYYEEELEKRNVIG